MNCIKNRLKTKNVKIYKQFHKEKDESMTYKWNEDHFKRATYLTVSSQLQLEALTYQK